MRIVAVLLALSAASLAVAGPITPIDYYVNQTIGAGGVTGYVETDGTIGTLGPANILGWDLLLNDGTSTWNLPGGSFFPFTGSDLSATASQLLFNFSGTDGGVFDISDASLDFNVCLSSASAGCWLSGTGGGETIFFMGPDVHDNQFTSLSGTQAIATMTLVPLQGGEPTAPIMLPNGLGGLYGTIGGYGSQSYWLFTWGGGAFSASASINDPPSSSSSYLFSEESYNGVTCASGGPNNTTLSSGDLFAGTVSVANLAAGEYCIGFDANNLNDPNFAITFNTPVGAVPEPSAFLLLSLGLAMFALRRRQAL